MSIYNEYGMLPPDLQERLSSLEKKVFPLFLEEFVDYESGELRILFHEFQSSLDVAMAEEMLIRAMKQKKATQELRRVRTSKLSQAEGSIIYIPIDDSEMEPTSNPDPVIQEGDLLSDNPNEDEGDK
jgi:hypothetical protein